MPSWQDCLRAKPEFRSHRHLSPWNSKREQFSKLCPQRDSDAFAERYENGITAHYLEDFFFASIALSFASSLRRTFSFSSWQGSL